MVCLAPPFCRWQPTISLKNGLKLTYHWIKGQLEEEAKEGKIDASKYSRSMVVSGPEALSPCLPCG